MSISNTETTEAAIARAARSSAEDLARIANSIEGLCDDNDRDGLAKADLDNWLGELKRHARAAADHAQYRLEILAAA